MELHFISAPDNVTKTVRSVLKCVETELSKRVSFLAEADERKYCIRSKAKVTLIFQTFWHQLAPCSILLVFSLA